MQYLALWGICEEHEVVMAVWMCVCVCVSRQFSSTVGETELSTLCNTHIKLTQ